MARSLDKRFLNCNESFADINEHTIDQFRDKFKDTKPVLFVQDHYHEHCFFSFGSGILQNVSCKNAEALLDLSLVKVAKDRYILDNALTDNPFKDELANIGLQASLCLEYTDPDQSQVFGTVANIMILGVTGILASSIASNVFHLGLVGLE